MIAKGGVLEEGERILLTTNVRALTDSGDSVRGVKLSRGVVFEEASRQLLLPGLLGMFMPRHVWCSGEREGEKKGGIPLPSSVFAVLSSLGCGVAASVVVGSRWLEEEEESCAHLVRNSPTERITHQT